MHTVLKTIKPGTQTGFIYSISKKHKGEKKGIKLGLLGDNYNIPSGSGYLHSTKKATDGQDHRCIRFTK